MVLEFLRVYSIMSQPKISPIFIFIVFQAHPVQKVIIILETLIHIWSLTSVLMNICPSMTEI